MIASPDIVGSTRPKNPTSHDGNAHIIVASILGRDFHLRTNGPTSGNRSSIVALGCDPQLHYHSINQQLDQAGGHLFRAKGTLSDRQF